MSLLLTDNNDFKKKNYFSWKSTEKDGLFLTIRHRQFNKDVRLLYASFNRKGRLLAVSDHGKNIFIIDIYQNKCWGFPTNLLITTLKFSEFSDHELIVGTNYGDIHIIHVETSKSVAKLCGHKESVTNISFIPETLCLTVSKTEGLIWDLQSFSRLQVLSVEPNCTLKNALFIPEKNYIATCFDNDTILIWSYPDLQCIKKIKPARWVKETLKCVTITRNGRVMVMGGYSYYLSVFLMDDFSFSHFVELPNSVLSIKDIHFIPQPFDGGAHKMLGILQGNGTLYFYDMENNCIVNQLQESQEIIRFMVSSNGEHLACLFSEGHMNIYKIRSLLQKYCPKELPSKEQEECVIKSFKFRDSSLIEGELEKVLNSEKLKSILDLFGKYPDNYRLKIWTHLLHLPKNIKIYNGFINKTHQPCFSELEDKYPLENKASLKNLRRLLSNLVTWSPFLKDVSYLPVLVFPFVKIAQNNPVICFEAMCTIITNWCQYWFEYFPLPPVNVLGIIRNLLLEHDCVLATHLNMLINPKIYIWSLLETCFSEVLTSNDWCHLWDHILTNQPYFLLFSVVAYNILNREVLLSIHSTQDFEFFFQNSNPIDIKKLVSKAYKLMNSTSDINHPKQFLNEFTKLPQGHYPKPVEPPSIIFADGTNPKELLTLKKEKETLVEDEKDLEDIIDKTKQKLKNIKNAKSKNELLDKLETACKEEIEKERDQIQQRKKKLEQMRMTLYEEELALLDTYKKKLVKENISKKEKHLAGIKREIENVKCAEKAQLAKAESNLINSYMNIVKQKLDINCAFNKSKDACLLVQEKQKMESLQNQLLQDIQKLQEETKRIDYYKALCLSTSRDVIDYLIQRIQLELCNKTDSHEIVKEIESVSKDIEKEVSLLLGSTTFE